MRQDCPQCGGSFTKRAHNHKYCSRSCAEKARHNSVCESCGTSFYASPGHKKQGWGRYCSQSCATAGPNNPRYDDTLPDRICKTCGKRFRKKPCAVKRAEGIYCSLECRAIDKNKTLVCNHCGKKYTVGKSRKGSRYCSLKCQRAAEAPSPNCTCLECNKRFYRKPSDLDRPDKVGVGNFCSMRCKAKAMSKSQLTPSGADRNNYHGGKYDDLGGIYLRSGWEANYARYLNWLVEQGEIAKWEYEADTFEFHSIKRGTRFYTPDFKVFAHDGSYEYHEVKGYMDPKSRTKLKRMAKYYPEETVIVIAQDEYRAIAKWKSLIPNWQ